MTYLLREISTGKWVTQEEACASLYFISNVGHNGPTAKMGLSTSQSKSNENKANKFQNNPLLGLVVKASLKPIRNVKVALLSLFVVKRKC